MNQAPRQGAGALLIVLLLVTPGLSSAQELSQSVEAETFFLNEPAWLFGVRSSLGYDLDRRELYPTLGVTLGHVAADHLFLGGTLDVRLTNPQYVRVGFRLGVLFTAADFAWGMGAAPGFLAIPRHDEYGLDITWGAMARLRLTGRHYLTAHLEVDMLFELLGFDRSRVFLSGGLGWAITF